MQPIKLNPNTVIKIVPTIVPKIIPTITAALSPQYYLLVKLASHAPKLALVIICY